MYAIDYFAAKTVNATIANCMQTCEVQLKWKFLSTKPNSFWYIDNITINNNNNPVSVKRREVDNLLSINHHILRRQALPTYNTYYDNFDNGYYSTAIWSYIFGAIDNRGCGAQSYWLHFRHYSYRGRSAITQPLNLQQFRILTFYLLFGNIDNGCRLLSTNDGISVDYRVGDSGAWVNLESYSRSCCTVPTLQQIILPAAAQMTNVYLRWNQHNSNLYHNGYDVWAIDEVRIDEDNILYQDTFYYWELNTNMWLYVVGGFVQYNQCGRSTFSLYFRDYYERQAITQSLNFSQTEVFSIRFYFGLCDNLEINESIEILWRTDNGEWSLLEEIPSINSRYVTLGCYDASDIDSIQFRISQSVFSSYDTWSIDDFVIRSHNSSLCSAIPLPSLPSLTPTLPSPPTACNYYSDSFDNGLYKTSLWYTVSGIRISFRPCGIPLQDHYAMEFYSPSTRQLITQRLDLRGVELISFLLYSFSSTNGQCRFRDSQQNGYLSVAYSVAGNGIWYLLENFAAGCCYRTRVTIRLPVAAQINSVQLRWLDSTSTYTSRFNFWILDDVKIGENIDTVLYQDTFDSSINPTLWSSIAGGTTSTSYCGRIDVNNALVFYLDGVREATTQHLDLRQANAVSFYVRANCQGLEKGESVVLSIRAGYGDWMTLQAYSNIDITYFYVDIPANMKVSSAQIRWMQNVPSINGYDVWAIDTVEIHSTYPRTVCSVACISDNFNSGTYNISIWSSISGAQVATSPCSINTSSTALNFNQHNGTREAVTWYLDLSGMYAISFNLQLARLINKSCLRANSEPIRVYYSTNGVFSEWNEIGIIDGPQYVAETSVTLSLPINARNQSVAIRIAQPLYSTSVWSLNDFTIYSPDQCPPLSVGEISTVAPPMPTSVLPSNSECNYYWDNFDSGSYKTTLWSSFAGVAIVLSPCGTSTLQRYSVLFTYETRQLVTHALDLRGVESISFRLTSGPLSGCDTRVYQEGIYVSYKEGSGSSWNTLEYFPPSCCYYGRNLVLYLPPVAQVSSVYLRWSQQNYSNNNPQWVLDDVQIGKYVQTVLYSDDFISNFDSSIWLLILGADVRVPPCGETYSGNALYFSRGGKREAVTKHLDLRSAKSLSFYIRIGSRNRVCEQAEDGEDVELSYRINYGSWTILQTYLGSSYRDALYSYINLDQSLQVNAVQFRFKQQILGFVSYDVWSIDNFVIDSKDKETKCSMACYSDNFNSGVYDSELWSSVVIASITIPPCSDTYLGKSLYFIDGGTREAITNNLDLRGLYAITFTLQIGSYDNECDKAEVGDDVILYYLISGSSDWTELKTFDARTYIRVTTVTVPIPLALRVQGVTLRWAQPQHSGSLQDTWFIDDVGIYSPDNCPPNAYQSTTLNPVVFPTPTVNNALTCKYYFDNFNDGLYKTSLWYSVNMASVQLTPCSLPPTQHYAMQLLRSGQLITQVIDLQTVQYISFYSKVCNSNPGNLQVTYSIAGSGEWQVLEVFSASCCYSGTNITVYLPSALKVNAIQLAWSPTGHTNVWILDDVQIGENVRTILYQDTFTSNVISTMWSSIIGGNIAVPPCGAIQIDKALYFSKNRTREAITQFLDLRQANAVSFYLMTSSSATCNGLDNEEVIKLSIRAGYGSWVLLQTFTSMPSTYIYVDIPENMKVHSAQLRWMQNVQALSGYDVWAIDTVEVHSTYPKTACSVACISDNFNSGAYNTSVWNSVSGAQVTIPPCSINTVSKALYFNESNTRQVITNILDLQGMYAISFYLQIVRFNGRCTAETTDNVTVYYSTAGSNVWTAIETYHGAEFATEKKVTIPLPREARNQFVSLRIAQSSYSSSVWSISDFGIYSPNQCLPLSVTKTSVNILPTPTSFPSNTYTCNYYWDNFDSGSHKRSLWSSVTGIRVALFPCQPSSLHRYGTQFVYGARELVTHALDLRGVQSINFYLISGNRSYGCSLPPHHHGILFSYRPTSSASWDTLEYFEPSCCRGGKEITVYVPLSVQISSVHLRWSQPQYYTNSPQWVLDDVQIGRNVRTVVYKDEFSGTYDSSIWASVLGGIVTLPPCGSTYLNSALYFSETGKREAITQYLDLRSATSLSFYIRIGSQNGMCDQAEVGEGVELSYRINYDNWVVLQTFLPSSYRDSLYIYITIDQVLQVNRVQFRFKQQVLGFDSYDVWSIDDFVIDSEEKETKCSMACYSDNFNSGSHDVELWNSINAASITIPPCSWTYLGKSLYFIDGGTREAITNSLDLRGLYAITFTLQIGSYDNECDKAEVGDDVILYYLISGSSDWTELKTFDATAYIRATTITVSIPLALRVQGVTLRWAQPQHSGSLQDTWFIDDVGIYSPDNCPPNVYQSTTLNPVVIPTPAIKHPLICNYYFDDFNDGSYRNSVWQIASGIKVSSTTCGLPSSKRYAIEFYSNSMRHLITQVLDLRGVNQISFYLLSLSTNNGCSQLPSYNMYIGYKYIYSATWYTLETFLPSCCSNGKNVTIYLPKAVQADSVQLRWWQTDIYASWVLDDVTIGSIIDTVLYEDLFDSNINPTLWSSITGGYVIIPPCGVTDFGSALHFARSGIREAVTVPLDLRQATTISFFLQIGSIDSTCENAEAAEDLELSYKLRNSDWTLLQTYTSTSYRTSHYVYINVPSEIKVNGIQLRIAQTILATDSYDVWSIDTFTVHSMVQRPECSVACYIDYFLDSYNTSIWSTVKGATVAPLLCNTNILYSHGLIFNGSDMRYALTRSLDLSGLYAISFNLQIMSSNDECRLAPSGENVILLYSVNNGTWNELKVFNSENYGQLSEIIVELPLEVRQPNVAIQIMQSYHSQSIWVIDNFGVYSPDSCPPLNYAQMTTTISPTPLPYPSPTTDMVCNFYSDNFDSGLYKTSLWSTVTGVRVALQPCGLSYMQHYGMEFYSFGTRELTTDPLDLRGIEFIYFYLLSGSSSNGCSQPGNNEGIHVAYTVGDSSIYRNLEYYDPSCCSDGVHLRIHLPTAAQTMSVKIRWYQSTHAAFESTDVWVLDDVRIGINIDNYFYEDYFTDSTNGAIWESIIGGDVVIPPCGVTHSGSALYFSANGTRQAITQQLDLRHATGISFYLRIGSHNGRCENDYTNEAIILKWRVNYGVWVPLDSYGYFRESRYVYFSLISNMQVTGAQFQIMQSSTPVSNTDVWSIDDFIVHSMHRDTSCTVACYSDDFNNGQYSSLLWTSVDGATVTVPACSNQYLGNALYFEGSGIRQAITRPVDIRGFYAISFYLHIGSFSGNCEQAESGEHVTLHYQLANSTDWILLNSYDATSFIRETRISEALPRHIQQIGVTFRWMQASHSGALDDTWSLDNVGFHSPDDCPPTGYDSVNITSPTAATTTMISTSAVIVPATTVQPSSALSTTTNSVTTTSLSTLSVSPSSVTRSASLQTSAGVVMSSFSGMEPSPSSRPPPERCARNYDALNNGVYRLIIIIQLLYVAKLLCTT